MLQGKCLASQKYSNIKTVTPDWVADCITEKTLLDTVKYNPKYLMPDVVGKSPKQDTTEEPTTPSNPPRSASPTLQVTPVQFQPLSTPRTEGGSRTKEMLARIVNSRILASRRDIPVCILFETNLFFHLYNGRY